jgi:hypothetical protein
MMLKTDYGCDSIWYYLTTVHQIQQKHLCNSENEDCFKLITGIYVDKHAQDLFEVTIQEFYWRICQKPRKNSITITRNTAKRGSEYLPNIGQEVYTKHTWYVMKFISIIFLTGYFLDFLQFPAFLSHIFIPMDNHHISNALRCSARTKDRRHKLRGKKMC